MLSPSMSLYLYLIVLLIVFINTIRLKKHLQNGSFIYLYWLIIITTLVEGIGFYFLKIIDKPNPWLFKFYNAIEYTLLCCYFLSIFSNTILKISIKISVGFYITYIALGLAFPFDLKILNTYKFLVMAIFVCIWSVIYLRSLLQSDFEMNLWENPHFWINTSFLLFYAGAFLLMSLIFYIYEKDLALAKQLFSINHVLNIFYYSIMSYGFICQSKLMN